MLIKPKIISNEIDRGYLGRFMRLNGRTDTKEFLRSASDLLFPANKNKNKLPIEILSNATDLPLKKLICLHTTLPFRRAITGYSPEISHGSQKNHSMLRLSSMRSARPGAYFCKDCVEEERGNIGFSYWHRDQQIPGLLWCPKHQTSLDFLEDENSYLFSPATSTESQRVINQSKITKLQSSESITRFIGISQALMERKSPLDSRHVSYALKQRAIQLKLRNYGGKRNSLLLSDLVLKSFNKEWLIKTFPVMVDKIKGTAMSQLDGIFYGKKVSPPVTAFILAATVLYDSAENTLADIITARKKKNKHIDPAYRTRLDDTELKNSYIKNRGDHIAVVDDIGRKKHSVTSRLISLGLPNLADKQNLNQDFLEAFLVQGKSLSETKEMIGVSDKKMEYILRTIGNSYVQVIKEINKNTT